MSIGYSLVNVTRKEQILFSNLPVSTRHEIESNPVSAFMVEWYRKSYSGDEIDFVSDTYEDWPFEAGSRSDLSAYDDVTDKVITRLIDLGLILDLGNEWEDEEEPSTVFIRSLALIKTEQAVTSDQDKLGQ